jgi:hypothetical protein
VEFDFELGLGPKTKGLEPGQKEPLEYSLYPRPYPPPALYEPRRGADGELAVTMPRPQGGIVIAGIVAFVGSVVWVAIAGVNGSTSGILWGLLIGAWASVVAGRILFQRFAAIRWSVSNGRLTKRVLLNGRCLRQRTFNHITALQIENRIWRTGGGSTDSLCVRYASPQAPAYLNSFTIRKVEAASAQREVPELGRRAIAWQILDLGRYLSGALGVPIDVAVSFIREPSQGDA